MSSGFLSPKIFLETAFHLYSKETFSCSKTEERKKREDEMRSIVINHDLHWTQGTRSTDSSILAELQLVGLVHPQRRLNHSRNFCPVLCIPRFYFRPPSEQLCPLPYICLICLLGVPILSTTAVCLLASYQGCVKKGIGSSHHSNNPRLESLLQQNSGLHLP